MAAERWGGGRTDGGAVFKMGMNKRDNVIELDVVEGEESGR